jgi:hypothetical protein
MPLGIVVPLSQAQELCTQSRLGVRSAGSFRYDSVRFRNNASLFSLYKRKRWFEICTRSEVEAQALERNPV